MHNQDKNFIKLHTKFTIASALMQHLVTQYYVGIWFGKLSSFLSLHFFCSTKALDKRRSIDISFNQKKSGIQ